MGTSSILAVVAAFALVLMVGVVRGDLGGNSEDILMLPEQSVKMECESLSSRCVALRLFLCAATLV